MIGIIIVLFLLGIYLACCRCAFLMYQLSHYHPKGRWNNIEPLKEDLFWTYMPFFNIFPAVDYLKGEWVDEIYKRDTKYTDHFKPKDK